MCPELKELEIPESVEDSILLSEGFNGRMRLQYMKLPTSIKIDGEGAWMRDAFSPGMWIYEFNDAAKSLYSNLSEPLACLNVKVTDVSFSYKISSISDYVGSCKDEQCLYIGPCEDRLPDNFVVADKSAGEATTCDIANIRHIVCVDDGLIDSIIEHRSQYGPILEWPYRYRGPLCVFSAFLDVEFIDANGSPRKDMVEP